MTGGRVTGTATCTTTSTNLDITNSSSYRTVAKSLYYNVVFNNGNTTKPIASLNGSAPFEVGISLGAPLGLCPCVLIGLFICRHRQHKLRSRMKHARVVATVN